MLHYIKIEDKHSSLLCSSKKYEEKSFVTLAPDNGIVWIVLSRYFIGLIKSYPFKMCLFGNDSKRKKAFKKWKQIACYSKKVSRVIWSFFQKVSFTRKKALLLDSVSLPLTVLSGKSKLLKKLKTTAWLCNVMPHDLKETKSLQNANKRKLLSKMQNVIKYLIMEY